MSDPDSIGKQRIYNAAFKERGRDDVVKWDIFNIQNHEKIKVIFESSTSAWRQGIWLRSDRGLLINGLHGASATLWLDTAPPEIICECFTEDGFLSVYNIWDSGRGYGTESQKWSSGMLIEELSNGRRYRCNDIGFETSFEKLIFRIERAVEPQANNILQ